jgi:hypothetical protein
MSVKPWQIAVIVLGLLAAIGLIVYTLSTSEGPHVNSVLYLVDVESGDLYQADLEKHAVPLPAPHPVSHKVSLVRINKNADGKWAVSKRDKNLLGQLGKDVQNKAVDPDSGDLVTPIKTFADYSPQR